MKFTVPLALVALAASASAYDYRELIAVPSCVDYSSWRATFTQLCPIYPPAVGKHFVGQMFQPGNYEGTNLTTEALVFCAYARENGTVVLHTDEIVAQLGGTFPSA